MFWKPGPELHPEMEDGGVARRRIPANGASAGRWGEDQWAVGLRRGGGARTSGCGGEEGALEWGFEGQTGFNQRENAGSENLCS